MGARFYSWLQLQRINEFAENERHLFSLSFQISGNERFILHASLLFAFICIVMMSPEKRSAICVSSFIEHVKITNKINCTRLSVRPFASYVLYNPLLCIRILLCLGLVTIVDWIVTDNSTFLKRIFCTKTSVPKREKDIDATLSSVENSGCQGRSKPTDSQFLLTGIVRQYGATEAPLLETAVTRRQQKYHPPIKEGQQAFYVNEHRHIWTKRVCPYQ